MTRFLSALAAAMLLGGVAQAASPVSATLAAPTTKTEVITEFTIWKCAGTTCTTRSNPEQAGSLSECRALVGKVGQVTDYGSADHAFDAEKLARCNGK